MPTQGSPNTAFVAGAEQDAFPRQAFDTTALEVVALHVPAVKDPHVPLGAP